MSVHGSDAREGQSSGRSSINPVIRFGSTPLVWINIVADGADQGEWVDDPEFFARFRSWMSAEKIFAANVPSSWGAGRHSTAFHRKDAPRVIAYLDSQGCLPSKGLEV
jgi:hypothetical protein